MGSSQLWTDPIHQTNFEWSKSGSTVHKWPSIQKSVFVFLIEKKKVLKEALQIDFELDFHVYNVGFCLIEP